MVTFDSLLKTARSPGLCSADEINKVVEFMERFQEMLGLYRSVHGEPLGGSVLSKVAYLRSYIRGA